VGMTVRLYFRLLLAVVINLVCITEYKAAAAVRVEYALNISNYPRLMST
jgi:hypothetical protein